MTALICIIWVIFKFYTNLGSLRTWNMICSQSPMSTGNTWKDFMHSHTTPSSTLPDFTSPLCDCMQVQYLSSQMSCSFWEPHILSSARMKDRRGRGNASSVQEWRGEGRSHPWWEDWGMMKGKHSSIGRYWKLVGAGLLFSLERKTFLWTLNSSKKCWQLLMNMSALCEELLKKWSSELNQHWDVVFFHKNCANFMRSNMGCQTSKPLVSESLYDKESQILILGFVSRGRVYFWVFCFFSIIILFFGSWVA